MTAGRAGETVAVRRNDSCVSRKDSGTGLETVTAW
jgi:hypothetical protein